MLPDGQHDLAPPPLPFSRSVAAALGDGLRALIGALGFERRHNASVEAAFERTRLGSERGRRDAIRPMPALGVSAWSLDEEDYRAIRMYAVRKPSVTGSQSFLDLSGERMR